MIPPRRLVRPLAVRDVRTTCLVLERGGVRAQDLAAFTEDPAAQMQG